MSRTIMLSAAAIVVFLFYTLVTSVDLSMVGNSQPNQSIAKRVGTRCRLYITRSYNNPHISNIVLSF